MRCRMLHGVQPDCRTCKHMLGYEKYTPEDGWCAKLKNDPANSASWSESICTKYKCADRRVIDLDF